MPKPQAKPTSKTSNHWYTPKKRDNHSEWTIVGKTVIVTGANTGIGKATAMELACRGAKLIILACRNVQIGEAAANEIRSKLAQSAATTIVVRQLDLSSLESVRKFAAEIVATENVLHVLVNNAGILGPPARTLSTDGNELTFATNHLGHFLLTNLLSDLLKRSGPSRIINVSSHWFIFWLYSRNFHLIDDPNLEKSTSKYSPAIAYSRSKWANVLFTRSLHQRLNKDNVTSYAVHPGIVATEITRNLKVAWLANKILPFIISSPAQGSQTSVYCATEPGIENLSSNYFMDCRPADPGNHGDNAMAEELWKLSDKLTSPSQITEL